MVGMGFSLIVLCSRSSAQSLSSLSQMFGGGSKQSQNSSQSNAAITVKRNAVPFLGVFDGKEIASPGTPINTKFACYPARDSSLPHERTFVCYSEEASGGEPNRSAGENIDR
jgi:hypothetical protein